MGAKGITAGQQTVFAEEITTIKRVKVEFNNGTKDLDSWQRFFELCLQYAEIAKQRAAESASSMLLSDTHVSDTYTGMASATP